MRTADYGRAAAPCSEIRELVDQLDSTTPERWLHSAACQALDTFHEAARRVPAYGDFLLRQGVRAARIRTPEHLCEVPVSDRVSYIDQYPIEALVLDGDLASNTLIGATPGRGTGCIWPLSADEMPSAAILYELMYFYHFEASQRSTLLAICLDDDSWTTAVYTLLASQYLNQIGYAFSIVTPGTEFERVADSLSLLAPKFGQTIIAGTPAFVSDFLEGPSITDRLADVYQLRFLLAGASFSEAWRDRLAHLASPVSPARVACGLLGSPDAGLMGFETSASISFRRLAASNAAGRVAAFGDERLPMLFNYIPTQRWFEVVGEELVVTARRALPLVRYNTHINGQLPSAQRMSQCLSDPGPGHRLRTLPFVAVHDAEDDAPSPK